MAGAVTSSDYNRGDDFGRMKKQTEARATGAFVAPRAGWCADCTSGPARELQFPPVPNQQLAMLRFSPFRTTAKLSLKGCCGCSSNRVGLALVPKPCSLILAQPLHTLQMRANPSCIPLRQI